MTYDNIAVDSKSPTSRSYYVSYTMDLDNHVHTYFELWPTYEQAKRRADELAAHSE